MGFYKSPTLAHYGSKVIKEAYIGCGLDENKCILKLPDNNKYLLFTSRPIFSLTSTLGNFTPAGSCGGEVAFTGNGWSIYFSNYFKSATQYQPATNGTWLLVRNAPYIGYIPRAGVDWDAENTTWTYSGDTWYSTASLTTIGNEGTQAGTFNGVSQDVSSSQIQVYISVSPLPSQEHSTLIGDWGSFYIGFPTWNIEESALGIHQAIFRRWNGDYYGLRYVESDNIDGVPCQVQGYIPIGLPSPNLTSGFFMSATRPRVESNFIINHYHFVPFDHQNPREGGYLTMDSGPDLTARWYGFNDEANLLAWGVPPRALCKQVSVFETAIWR